MLQRLVDQAAGRTISGLRPVPPTAAAFGPDRTTGGHDEAGSAIDRRPDPDAAGGGERAVSEQRQDPGVRVPPERIAETPVEPSGPPGAASDRSRHAPVRSRRPVLGHATRDAGESDAIAVVAPTPTIRAVAHPGTNDARSPVELLLPPALDEGLHMRHRGAEVVGPASPAAQWRTERRRAAVEAGGAGLTGRGNGRAQVATPEVHVHIGRLHVTAAPDENEPAAPRTRAKAPEPTSLADHLSRRSGPT